MEALPLPTPEALRRYWFGARVSACARAEALAGASVRSLVWIDPVCLVVQPPLGFDLGDSFDVAVRPVHIQNVGLMRRWLDLFESLVRDEAFQAARCADERRRIFLFQAVMSALFASALDWNRICILPPERRAQALNDLVTVAYEERSLDPAAMDDIEAREPLRSWLAAKGE